ncbi:MAG: hypothetical protein HN856_16800 [Gammaproteobacteria bacterium]|nr:hypothetical protein [Gammaproteobacteria bacterium]
MSEQIETWCDRDEHKLFEYFSDFNEWLDSPDEDGAQAIRKDNGIDRLSQPSKAFYAGDKEAYDQAFKAYRLQRRHDVLSKESLNDHWYERNEERFNQLVERLLENGVVPFVGAGVSVAGGFPSWKNHLRQQGTTAGIDSDRIEHYLANGQYETVIEEIESKRGRDVFAQEIRDVFSKTGEITGITLRLSELFSDTLITTNYDRLLEQALDTGSKKIQAVHGIDALTKADPKQITIYKLHGDTKTPHRCILGKSQYDTVYGADRLDMTLPIPKLLQYYFTNSSLLFVGCSMRNDRTMQVFKAVKQSLGDRDLPQHFSIEQLPDAEEDLVTRNAELLSLGMTAIWYESGQYHLVEEILRHARNEVTYLQGDIEKHRPLPPTPESPEAHHKGWREWLKKTLSRPN